MTNVQVTSKPRGFGFPLKKPPKIACKKYRKKGIPDLWDSIFTPKLPASPCLALPPWAGILPAQKSTQKPRVVLALTALEHQPSPWSAALERNQVVGISREMSEPLCFTFFGRGKRSCSKASTRAAETGGEIGRLRHPG